MPPVNATTNLFIWSFYQMFYFNPREGRMKPGSKDDLVNEIAKKGSRILLSFLIILYHLVLSLDSDWKDCKPQVVCRLIFE